MTTPRQPPAANGPGEAAPLHPETWLTGHRGFDIDVPAAHRPPSHRQRPRRTARA
ncbi:hypothetical protein J4032_18620 [Streptomyces formicae]|uniref:Uncharacterized protein n=1 Tax=Streptomyces formicae TaxID=1616117 RepID=A0ABY3WRV6_9ACTN|nr:hypothetical protein [Streptomyces formicae]UNM13236.1 hypothetical protein J4032_18620 [Streptomyces formicae]